MLFRNHLSLYLLSEMSQLQPTAEQTVTGKMLYLCIWNTIYCLHVAWMYYSRAADQANHQLFFCSLEYLTITIWYFLNQKDNNISL